MSTPIPTDSRTDANVPADAPSSTTADGTNEKLPSGWLQFTTGDGLPYYYNEKSGESSWELPEPGLSAVRREDDIEVEMDDLYVCGPRSAAVAQDHSLVESVPSSSTRSLTPLPDPAPYESIGSTLTSGRNTGPTNAIEAMSTDSRL
jgi:WW domain